MGNRMRLQVLPSACVYVGVSVCVCDTRPLDANFQCVPKYHTCPSLALSLSLPLCLFNC